jgi:hypothetical protein
MRIKSFSVFLVLIFCSFFSIDRVFASGFTDYGGTSSGSFYVGPGSGSCNSYACWTAKQSNGYVYGYRVTLVDDKGKIIPNTRSVDVGKSSSSNYSNRSSYLITKNFDLQAGNGSSYVRINSNYEYRFTHRKDASGNEYGANSAGDYVFISLPNFPDSGTSLDSFIQNEIIALNSIETMSIRDVNTHDPSIFKYLPLWKSTYDVKVDFVSFILHYVGFFGADVDFYYERLTDLTNKYLIFEPLFTVQAPRDEYGNIKKVSVYGTATEIGFAMYSGDQSHYVGYGKYVLNDTLLHGLYGNQQVGQLACGSYDRNSPLISKPIGSNKRCWNDVYSYLICGKAGNGCIMKSNKRKTVEPLVDLDRGFGYRPVKIEFSDVGTNAKYGIDLCESNDGNISFYPIQDSNMKNTINSETFKVSGEGPTAIYCYDSVTYDFSKTLDDLSKTRSAYSSFNLEPGKASIKRVCYFNSKNVSYDYSNSIKNDYNNAKINLNYNNRTYTFVPTIRETGKTESNIKGSHEYRFEIDYNLKIDLTDNKTSNGKGYIDFSNISSLFGRSNGALSQLFSNGSLTTSSGVNITLDYIDGNKADSEHRKCSFNYKIDKVDVDSDFQFRVISLEDPFPARDGTVRLPGLNWLDKDNKVFPYIINNRGIRYVAQSNDVSPEAIYTDSRIKPMYTVTLTPSTMLKIREYNKKYKYDSMYTSSSDTVKLQCDSEGRQCYSPFLRDLKYMPNGSISGECLIVQSSTSLLRMYLDNYERYSFSEDLRKKLMEPTIGYEKSYDINKNYRIDAEDYIISTDKNKGKNTRFYTCANKNFFSGGPVEDGGI